ncbi:MAG: class I SAM-dependent methyltransferase [Flavisolibacter sp.]
MAEKEWFKEWFNSPFYHKLYFQRDEKEAHLFIDKLIKYLNPPAGSRMIDFACGRGRHCVYLATKGYDITGIDLSQDSIAIAKQFENEQLHFFQHDMRLPAWVNYFHYGFNFFTSFGYFFTLREHQDAMRTISNSIYEGGTIVFDYLNVHYVEDRMVHSEIKKIDDTTYKILRWQDKEHFFKQIEITDGSVERPLSFCERVAKMSLEDFTGMLSLQKFKIQDVFGDYNLNPYQIKNTPRMIIVAKKQHAN